MPEISLPDIKLPDVRFRDGRLRDMKLPDIDLRDHLPDVDLSKLSMPGVLRDMSMPEVSLSGAHLPDVHAPDVHLSDLSLPKFQFPDVDLSRIDTRRLRELTPFAKPGKKSPSPLPWVIVAGAAGLFAGWFLATSPVAGPMVRGMVGRVRDRMNAWRAGRSEWEDAEERTEGFWADEHGWRAEGSQRGEDRPAGSFDQPSSDESARWEAAASMAAIDGAAGDQSVGGTSFDTAESRVAPDTEQEG
jgi:hypothetical protein